jgi:hypothetical protein
MPNPTTPTDNPRLAILKNAITDKPELHATFEKLFTDNKGDWAAMEPILKKSKKFNATVIKDIAFAHELANWNDDNKTLVSVFQKNKETNSLRDIALNINKEGIKKLITGPALPKGENKTAYADKLYHSLNEKEPTALLVNMINDPKVPILNNAIGKNVASVLEKQTGFNIKTTSIYEVLKKQNVFTDIPAELHEEVTKQLKTLQRITAVSVVPDAVPVLYNAQLHTAFQIASLPAAQFMQTMKGKGLEEATIMQIHSNAQQSFVRNEHSLIALQEVSQGTGIALIDKSLNAGNEKRSPGLGKENNNAATSFTQAAQTAAEQNNLSWNLLFVDADFCECGECTSVYSAAAYFVELLQYLRNNNLDPDAKGSLVIKTNPRDISGTPLQKLLARRPDLGCLELTCKNTNTILPYVDLVNEVMENYVAFNHLKPFNVADETSSELLAAPQHTEYEAYRKLNNAVYPFILPYHQPVDAARTYLNHLGTSRYELCRSFRIKNSNKDKEQVRLMDEALDRAADAEYLGLTKEEYIILTKQGFESKPLTSKMKNKNFTDEQYQILIGVKPVCKYYGYDKDRSMLDNAGLTLIKKEFLVRTGVDYFNLVDLLKTGYINPCMPGGKSKVIMEKLHFSYRVLQSYVKIAGIDKVALWLVGIEKAITENFKKIEESIPVELSCPNPNSQQSTITDQEIIQWVKCHFEKVGKMIVIENGRKCVNGKILIKHDGVSHQTLLVENCKIFIEEGHREIGSVDKNSGKIISLNPQGGGSIVAADYNFIGNNGERGIFFLIGNELYLILLEQKDSCDLDTATLQHLDGTPLTVTDYDRIHRFIRLRRKLGWTIDETDKAILGLSIEKIPGAKPELGKGKSKNSKNDCDDLDEEELAKFNCNINPFLIHQLVAVKKLLAKTGLELTKVLSFWSSMSTSGEKPLYQQLFLTHNILGVDKIFKADNGNYLTVNDKLSDHMPVVMAALNLSADDIAAIIKDSLLEDKLTIDNLSILYRYRLLSKVLGLRIRAFINIIHLFGDVFKNADTTLAFLENWIKLEEAGFTPQQLKYILGNIDDEKKPFSPSKKQILQLTKTLYDGLNAIDDANQDLKADPTIPNQRLKEINIQEQATTELVITKASLYFEIGIVEKIIGILEGTNLFTTEAPPNLNTVIDKLDSKKDSIVPPARPVLKSIRKKLKYDAVKGSIQITGILTDAEETECLAWGNNKWEESLSRISKKQNKLFNEIFSGIFDEGTVDELKLKLLIGDIIIPLSEIPTGAADTNTGPQKRVAFLEVFLPFLRKELSRRFIIDTLSIYAGLEKDITDVLVSEVLTSGSPETPIYDIFKKIKNSAVQPANNAWGSYLIPDKDAVYTFIIKNSTAEPAVSIDGVALEFVAQEDTTKEWWSKNISLQSGKLYKIDKTDTEPSNLFWKTTASAIVPVPSSALLPDFASEQCTPALVALKKAAMLIDVFALSADEIKFLNLHKANFDNLNFNALTITHCLRLEAYTRLRNSLPKEKPDILDFLKWTNDVPTDQQKLDAKTKELSNKIAELTTWKKESIDKLIAADHFNIVSLKDYLDEKNLIKLQEALTVSSKIGMDINKLFDWAKPISDFGTCKTIADNIQKTIRAQYKQSDWEQVVKPLNDLLRNNQKNALIGYLLQQSTLKNAGVTDADGLFEYFLIDVQMDTCMETSRIKQAISSVQLFIQRSFLGLEKDIKLSRERWEWMQRYRVWEANRKVFLYPENWIESNLRDDKSPFFKELESELLQKDINKQNVTDALKAYLYKVDEVANMEVIGLYVEGEKETATRWRLGAKLHVFSRTRNAPYFYYYRYMALDEGNWYPWEKMQVDIPSIDMEDGNGQIVRNGCYLTPVVWNGRLLIFFPQFLKKTKANSNAHVSIKDSANGSTEANKPIEYWEIKMAWSEYRNGKWTQKQINKNSIVHQVGNIPNFSAAASTILETARQKAHDSAAKASDVFSFINTSIVPKIGILNAQTVVADALADATDKAYEDLGLVALQLVPLGTLGAALDLDSKVSNIKSLTEAAKNTANELFNRVSSQPTLSGKMQTANTLASSVEPEIQSAINALAGNIVLANTLPEIQQFEFVAVPSNDNTSLGIRVFYENATNVAWVFEFDGNTLQSPPQINSYTTNNAVAVNNFHYNNLRIKSLQPNLNESIYFDATPNGMTYLNERFHHNFTSSLLGNIKMAQLDVLFNYQPSQTITPEEIYGVDFDNSGNKIYNELKKPYSLYNWELFFHTPIMLADALSKAQQFEEAMKWFHYVFNPMEDGNDDNRFWKFTPFKTISSRRILDSIFNNLQSNKSDKSINEWRNKPFMPHVVARRRPVAYMKWVVMKYIDNLFAWGDYLFRQDTIESINQATQLYILALHILGPRPMIIPKRGKIKSQTYLGLLNKWDAFGNAIVELELSAPFSNQITLPFFITKDELVCANIYGFSTTTYFCIPNNPKLMGYWDNIADRLFKIRHCQNIEGVFRKLPLFEPPIDPALLVKAAAQGLSISSVINDLNSAMPNYRFYYLLQKALELCNELKSLGGAMLSAIEKKDNETIGVIRARHEGTMNNLVMEIKKLQLEEAEKSLDSLYQNRKAPEARMRYYLQLAGEDANKMPAADSDFAELANTIEKPIDESGLRLSKFEKEDMDKANLSADLQLISGIPEVLAGILYAIPMLAGDVKPLGVGAGASFGGTNLGQLTQTISKGLQIASSHLSHQSSIAGKKGGFQRALQERIQQANAAGFELKQIDKQITAQQIRIDIANKEINNHQKQIDNANEVEEFLKNKYTNEELYTWMRGSLKTLYKQVYNLAYDLAKKAEKTYCFERGISNANFIQSGYFDAGREGLLAGEQLYVGLKQLEAAYQEKRGYDYEITKHISLRQLDPFALLQLKAGNKCNFDLPEVLFDMDFPGHYKRRIKSVSISIPCIAGPYVGINATFRLMNNEFRNSAIASNYLKKTGETDDRFITYNIPITGIATSSAQNDSGMFELNFKDERYLPFEGAGVISGWHLELPEQRQFDYNTISDVVLHVKYIASEGGENLKGAAKGSVEHFVKATAEFSEQGGLYALINLKHDMPNEWNLFAKGSIAKIKIDVSRLSYLAKMNSKIEHIAFIANKEVELNLIQDIEKVIPPNPAEPISLKKMGGLFMETKADNFFTINSAFGLSLKTPPPIIDELIMVVKYKLEEKPHP